ncbi:MAG: PQQ-dependent sugar dehydrogenase [Chloroflexi bacterium]|nr:PQQ-dependent sugar dehydrogenase [Chloroflexota bacterium]
MNKTRFVFPILLLLTFLVSCKSIADQPPAPTSIPLANPQTGVIDPSLPVIAPEHSISLPEGFGITVFIDELADPRMMAFGPDLQLYVSEPSTGRVLRLPDMDADGIADGVEVAAEGFINPTGIAFYQDGSLYVAETTRVFRMTDPDGDGFFQDRETIVAGISAGGHTNHTIIFSRDWRHFYLAIGSSCNVCREQDMRRGGVMRYKADGSEERIFSQGLRYAIGLAFRPDIDILWAAVMEREGLENSLPPETIYAIYIDADGGWPACHAGRIIDPDFGNIGSCGEGLLTPQFELESQSAPYGLEFYTGDQFPEEYQKDLFVALHGTGDGASAKGYKIIRIPLGGGGSGLVQDFAIGWLDDDGSPLGSPTDLVVGPEGSLYVSDDSRGVIYRIFYSK